MRSGVIHYGADIKRDGPVLTPWQAKWIWGQDSTTMHNWMCMRKTVVLDTIPASAVARIAVDSRYWLWVNGKAVIEDGQLKRGPTAKDTYFEYVELAPYLHMGENTVAVLAVYYGADSAYYSYCPSGFGAFVMEAELGRCLLKTDETWKVKRHTAFLNRQKLKGEGPSYRIPEEHNYYDARLEAGLENWQAPGYDDSDWENAIVCGSVGDAPWGQVWERSIPQMKYWPRKAYENTDTLAPFWEKATAEPVSIGMQLPYNMHIQPYLKIEAPAGLEIQMLSDGDESLNTYYVTREGVQEFEGYYWMSAQTLTYRVPAGVKVLDLQYRQSGYNCEFAGSFSCEDKSLTALWQKALYTLYITMRDTYMDCPDRERAQWWGDCTNEAHMAFYALSHDAYLLYRKGVDSMLNWRSTDLFPADRYHVLQTVVPIDQEYFELPMQQLAGIVGFWTYYLYTGEQDFLRQVYQPAMDYLKLWVLGRENLLVHRIYSWDWMDWGEQFDAPVIENAWYCWALMAVKNIAAVLARTEDITWLDGRYSTIAKAFRKKFWTGRAYHAPEECYTDYGYSYKFVRPEAPDDRANALAVLAGLAAKQEYPTIAQVLKKQYNSSPYMEKYVLDALFLMGQDTLALKRMKTRYQDMIDDASTTLWEHFIRGWGTKNHAWSGGPLINLSGNVAGIAPDTPGYARYHVLPQMGALKHVKAIVPSVRGDIRVEICRDADKREICLTLDSPADTIARVGIPKSGSKVIRVSVDDGAVFDGEDGKYVYYLVTPGHWKFGGSL